MRAISSIVCGFALAVLVAGAMPALAQDKSAASAMTPEKALAGAKVFIVSPKDGATVGQDVTVEFGVEGIALVPATSPKPDSGHHHLLIDARELPPTDAPIPADATHKHYGKAQTSDTVHLEPGTHTLQLDFGDARHMQFDPRIVSKKITIHVK